MSEPEQSRTRGRPRKYASRRDAVRAAVQAHRERERARRQSPDIEDRGIIDLSAIPAYRVRR